MRLALGSPPPPPHELLCSILASALHLAYVSVAPGGTAGPQGTSYLIRDAKGENPEPSVAALHPSSVNSRGLSGGGWLAPYIAFHECVRTTKLYVRDCSPAPLLPLLLFGGATLRQADPAVGFAVAATQGGMELSVDGWLNVKVQPPRVAKLVIEMRQRVDALLQRMVTRANDSSRRDGQGVAAGGVGMDASPLVGAVVELFKIEARPEVTKTKKGKSKSKAKSGGGSGPSWQDSIFNDPYNDVGGRGGLYEF